MPAEPAELLVIFSTFPDHESARQAAATLVDERLAACVNLLPGVTSIYTWKGETHDSTEVLALIKTTRTRYPAVEARLRTLHPYEVPEIIGVPLATALPAYAQWLLEGVS